MNFFLSKSIYSRVVHPFLFPRSPRSHVARSVNRGKGARIPGVRVAPSSRAPLVHKRGVGGAPPSYSRADPVRVSPRVRAGGRGRFRVCTAPGSCAPLARKRAGGAPPSYSHADPIRVSPQHAGQGEGALPGVRGPGFLCPPCTQTGGGWRTPFLFPRGPHSHVTPARGPGGVPLPGLCTAPGSHSTLCAKRKQG